MRVSERRESAQGSLHLDGAEPRKVVSEERHVKKTLGKRVGPLDAAGLADTASSP